MGDFKTKADVLRALADGKTIRVHAVSPENVHLARLTPDGLQYNSLQGAGWFFYGHNRSFCLKKPVEYYSLEREYVTGADVLRALADGKTLKDARGSTIQLVDGCFIGNRGEFVATLRLDPDEKFEVVS